MKTFRALLPWMFDRTLPVAVHFQMTWTILFMLCTVAAPSTIWWARLICGTVLVLSTLIAYFFAYSYGEDRGHRTAKLPSPPPLLVPWDDAAIIEDNVGCLRVLLLPTVDSEPPYGTVRWRGKLPSRELREVDRFMSDLCARRPWESRQ